MLVLWIVSVSALEYAADISEVEEGVGTIFTVASNGRHCMFLKTVSVI